MALDLETGEITEDSSHTPLPKSLEFAFRTYAPEISSFSYNLRHGILEFTVDTPGILALLNECDLKYSYVRTMAFDDSLPPLRVCVQLQSLLSFYYRLIIQKQVSYGPQKKRLR